MPVVINKLTASIVGICTVEDAEPLLAWLLGNPRGTVDLKKCENLHTSVLQTLLIGNAKSSGSPMVSELAEWTKASLPAVEPKKRSRKTSVKLENAQGK